MFRAYLNWPVDVNDVEQRLLDQGEEFGEEEQHLPTHARRVLNSRIE